MITWPAIIKFAGDNELSFVATQSEWENDEDLISFRYDPEDQLIDSEGVIYSLNDDKEGVVNPKNTGEKIGLADITILIREHASELGNCCVSKLGFYSISEAVSTAGDLKSML